MAAFSMCRTCKQAPVSTSHSFCPHVCLGQGTLQDLIPVSKGIAGHWVAHSQQVLGILQVYTELSTCVPDHFICQLRLGLCIRISGTRLFFGLNAAHKPARYKWTHFKRDIGTASPEQTAVLNACLWKKMQHVNSLHMMYHNTHDNST